MVIFLHSAGVVEKNHENSEEHNIYTGSIFENGTLRIRIALPSSVKLSLFRITEKVVSVGAG
jgi:hypothetical protein